MFGIDDALLAALATSAAEAGGAAAAAAPAAGAGAGLAAAEGAGVLGAGLGAAEGAASLTPEVANMGLDAALGGASPAPMPPPSLSTADAGIGAMRPDAPIGEATVTGQPTQMPTDWAGRFKDAHGALRFASKLVGNKKDKQTLNLMSLATGLGASGGDMSKSPDLVMGPLNELAMATQEEEQPRLNQALSPLTPSAPSTAAPTPGGPTNATPSTSRAMASMPPTRLTPEMSSEERLRALYGVM